MAQLSELSELFQDDNRLAEAAVRTPFTLINIEGSSLPCNNLLLDQMIHGHDIGL